MTRTIRRLMLVEAGFFALAALIHAGAIVPGYEHREARIAETLIAVVLLVGLAAGWARPVWTRGASLAAQGFALFGTLVGIFTIVVGVGPRTVPDVVYHIGIVILLMWGLRMAALAPRGDAEGDRRPLHDDEPGSFG